jgi:ATP-dependent DNA helicase RecG
MMAAKKRTFNPEGLMDMALEVMRQSLHERRDDGKASPLVGAVLWKPDGSIETAARGELRYGDHAEYCLLERKNRSTALDGAVLFSTLEPCAPGARRHPKLGCAERIVLARVAEVWIGIEDPDPNDAANHA